MNKLFWSATLCMLFAFLQPGLATEDLASLGSTTGGAAYVSTATYGRLYVGAGSTLLIYDTQPIHAGQSSFPELLGQFHCESVITDIQVSGDTVYVAANFDGLYALDASDPQQAIPVLAHLTPDDPSTGAQDLTLSGDSILVANLTEMTVYGWVGSDLVRFDSFAQVDEQMRVTGAGVRGELIAVVVQDRNGSQNGVHFYLRGSLEPLPERFWLQPSGYPEDVTFADGADDILYLAGGTEGGLGRGFFHVLRTTSTATSLAYSDTVDAVPIASAPGFVPNIASRNDTVYVATLAGDYVTNGPCEGSPELQSQVRVYDCSNPDEVAPIGKLPAGLYHFDVALDGDLVHIASEWCGIKTLRARQIEEPVELSLTETGGAMTSVDVHGSRVAVGRDGYGFDVLEMGDSLGQFDRIGHARPGAFSSSVLFSQDGSTLFVGSSTLGFWWFDLSPLDQGETEPRLLDSFGVGLFGIEELAVSGDYLYAAHLQDVYRFDISDGETLQEAGIWRYEQSNWYCRDIEARGDTVLIAQQKPLLGGAMRVIVFGEDGTGVLLDEVTRSVQACKAVKWSGDEVLSGWANIGIETYRIDRSGGGFALVGPEAVYEWDSNPSRIRIDCDSSVVLVTAGPEGLLALERDSLTLAAAYRGSGGYRNLFDYVQGSMDVRIENERIFLADYHSQLGLLMSPFASSVEDPGPVRRFVRIFPNPFLGSTTVSFQLPGAARAEAIIYDMQGRIIQRLVDATVPPGEQIISWDGRNTTGRRVAAGTYFLVLSVDGRVTGKVKTVLLR